jgi:arylsulfatase A-like enzyme
VNIVWIVSDTMRPDCLGLNGGPAYTPNLDALARRSVVFRRAQASSFPTVPCRGDYVTGKYNFINTGWGPLPRDETTVAHRLGEADVCCAGVVDTPFYTQRGYNYDRGFTYFYDLPVQLFYGQSEARRNTNPYWPRGA